jgi:NAD(P)-dependent dehydrogenase (short-subunit alcohol dehydrogenase family)
MRLDERIALVVGGGGSLGSAIARAYRSEGARLVVADLDLTAAVRVLSETESDTDGLALAVDIADAVACQRLVETAVERFGRLDILVNCAALCLVDPLLEVTAERWERVFAVNVHGAFFLTQAAARVMVPRKFGRIIHISTPASRQGCPLFASYAASKAAVDSIVRSAAVAWASHGVTVNSIVPGRLTDGMIDGLDESLARLAGRPVAELRAERTSSLPMGRRVAPREVAEAAVWLASDTAAYVTAERFNFTGGMELS